MSEAEDLLLEARGLLSGERDPIANAANLAALIWMRLEDLNWAGFYFLKAGELVLGPFQGKPACVRIARGRGVCGTAAQSGKTQIVADVHAFAGHIACDAASVSELVVPLIRNGAVLGVIDLDSPKPDRFSPLDAGTVEALAQIWLDASQYSGR
jgi:L-methionine (R)-S-oxide reductase